MATTTLSNNRKPNKATSDYPQKPLLRLWYGFTLAVVLVAIILVVLYPVRAFEWRARPFFGATLSQTLAIDAGRPTTSTPWTGLEAGLAYRDRIVAINDQPLFTTPDDYAGARQQMRSIMDTVQPANQITVDFERDAVDGAADTSICSAPENGVATCRVSYKVRHFPEGDFLVFFIIPYVSGVIVLLIGLAILWLRRGQPLAWLAVITCMLMAVFMSGIFDYGVTQMLAPVWLTTAVLLGGALITFGMVFPVNIVSLYRWPLVKFVPAVISLILAPVVLGIWYYPNASGAFVRAPQIATTATIVGIAGLLVLMFYQRRRTSNAATRDQSNTILIGTVVMIAPVIIWISSQLVQLFFNSRAILPLSFEATMPFGIPLAASIAYALLQYRRVDTDRIISHGIAYLIMLVALAIGYFLLVLGASLLANQAVNPNNPILMALTIFIIAVLFLPIRIRLQRRVDAIYFRVRRNYQEKTEQFAQKLTGVNNLDQIIREFQKLLEETLSPINLFVFLPNNQTGNYTAYGKPQPETDVSFAPDSGVINLIKMGDQALYLEPGRPWPTELAVDRARLTILKALFIAGLSGSEELSGLVIVGPPRSGTGRYTYEELRFLMNVVRQFSLAVERAQVIESLQGRVRELDVLSYVGQAVNFNLEFDDILELISNQTNRLIDASYFYIALHDPTADQLYFAFFLEDDDRYPDKENQRWPVGRDLFSEIVRTNKSIRVDDYARTLSQRDVRHLYESPNLKAWMGVPLIVGSRTLGVLAVGKTIPGEIYNDAQLKIFSDIGALAATSLDKARLFAEANQRARQLAVLNEISQQLVATESDVEALLEIITSSAVDILNAEAGSLLLTVDDLSGDLEFRVAVGGSGQELVGSRLAAGQGLVGEVAKSGRPVIVNDAPHDPRHASNVSSTFHTRSVLAVPLIAKDKVIGVLEVLNKKDGTIYVDQDVDLLTTFAGQAAIAIENARLFQMTDLQLTQRIEELEILERIDTELNRTLDINKVAEITLRWAIANSGANAGMLGLVEDDPPHLRILAIYGYVEADFPDMVKGNQWPLDQGIVKRVMRTRQADLVTDTKIDPDYIPSLRGSLSQITVPMKSGDEINAILILETNREPRLNLSDWGFAQRLAEHASIAISNAQLYGHLTRAIESKSEFMGFAAHELKTPLSSVKGYTDVLLNGMTGDLDEQQKNFLRIIRSNADRLQTIIDDLRDAARADAKQLVIEPAPINFWHVTMETLRPFQKQLSDKRQELVNRVPENLPLIMGDQTRLIQVMTNLVSNAHKYSPPESTITINAEVLDNYHTIKGKLLGQVLRISIADTGIGMSEEDLSKLFKEQYFRSENPLTREQPGTGLGMMITRNIIEGHRGEIWVESELNVGTTFYFVIPLATKEEQMQRPTPEPASD